MNKSTSDLIISRLLAEYGDMEPDLNFNNDYQLLVAVVLSARTTDVQVNRVTPELFRRYPDFTALSRAKSTDVEKIIHSIGFFRTKAKNIIELAKIITGRYCGMVPRTMEELQALPGVGRKTANVVLSVAFDIPAFAVDTHVTRVSNRLGYIDSTDPLKVEKAVTGLAPAETWKKLHLSMIKHGRNVCKPGRPLCGNCVVSGQCSYFRNNA